MATIEPRSRTVIHRRSAIAVVAVAVVAAVIIVGAIPAATIAAPLESSGELILSAVSAEPGTTIGVRGTGLPTDVDLQLMLCGANGTHGTLDCLSGSSYILRAWDGTFELTRFLIDEPPAPCPCIIRLASTQSTFSLDVPFDVIGAPSAPIPPDAPTGSTLRIMAVTVRDVDNWQTAFGASAERVLEITVRNVGDAPIDIPSEVARWGRKGTTTRAITSIDAGTLEPGHQRTIELPFELPALSVGSYAVAGVVGVNPHSASFGDGTTAASTSTWPWGLVLVLVVVVQLIVIAWRNVLRRRLHPVTTDVR